MATSKLQRKFGDMLDSNFPQFRIRENYRPPWMISSDDTWMELDFYIEDIKVAIEVQGKQHFEYVPFFHGSKEAFKKYRKYDREKINLCRGRRVRFYEVCSEMDAVVVVNDIKERYCKKPKYFYQESDDWYKTEPYKKVKKRYLKSKDPNSRKNNADVAAARRLRICKKKLEAYENGELEDKGNKHVVWKKVIENNGYIE